MSENRKIIPFKCNTDLSENYFDEYTARFLKDVTGNVGATDIAGLQKSGQNIAVLKPLQSNALYADLHGEPDPGQNICVGAQGFPRVNRCYVWAWNPNGTHFIYRINGDTRTCEMVFLDRDKSCLNFRLDPRYFIHQFGAWLEVFTVTNPATGVEIQVEDLYWTNGLKYQGFIRTQDSIDTDSFNATLFTYFQGNYNKCYYARMGLSTPKDCIQIKEVERTDAEAGLNNNLLYNTWQFRVQYYDVWGRPSEYGIISNPYIPGINDCTATSDKIPRCLDLTFNAGTPFINTIGLAWRNCNDENWSKEETIFLWDKTNVGKWWLRGRNPDVNYNATDNTITYRFCRNKECDPIPVEDTNKLQPGLPKISEAINKYNNKIGLANNIDGFNPFPQELLKKIKVEVIPPGKRDLGIRNITILVPIWNEPYGSWASVHKDGTNGYYYGGVGSGGNLVPAFAEAFGQKFKNKNQKGFTGNLLGVGSVTSTQVVQNAAGQLVDDPDLSGSGNDSFPAFAKFVFTNVKAGKYRFVISSPLSDPNSDADYQQTSAFFWGVCSYTRTNAFNIDVNSRGNFRSAELLIDVCNGDYDTLTDNKMLVLADLAAIVQGGTYRVVGGYIYETRSNGYNQFPMELLNIVTANGFGSLITDHNGFYWYSTRGRGRTFGVDFYHKCNLYQARFNQASDIGTTFINRYGDEMGQDGLGFADFFTTTCNRVYIKGKIQLQGTNIGLSNVLVSFTKGSSSSTDDTGEFTIIAHDDAYDGVRIDKVLIAGGACGYTGENGICIQSIDVTFQKCSTCSLREILVGTTILQYISQRGLLSGGTYPIFVNGYDWIGRKTYSQPLTNITIPTIIESKTIAASTVQVVIDPSAIFPDEIDYITFSIGEETTIDKYIDWIVDRVQFIDNTGAINNQAPTQIRIFYQSIIEYSAVNNYNTNTSWQFIVQGSNPPTSVTSDNVQFFINGDGKFFTKLITSRVKYDTSGESFLIDYTSELKDLKENAMMRLVRYKTCTGTEPTYEVCKVVDIVAKQAVELNFILPFYDTYYLNRQIPVPAIEVPVPVVSQIATTAGNVTTYVVPPSAGSVLELRTPGYPFEHNSPSDLWGDGCKNIGRINAKNPFEAEIHHPNQIALSGALSINGQQNYLQSFDTSQKTDIELKDNSGIVAVIVENGQAFVITQYDNARVGFNDNLARMDAQGNIQVPSAANTFGRAERKAGDNYGCKLIDKNTIQYRNGLVSWVDRSRAEAVQYNFSQIRSYTRDERVLVDGVKVGKYDAAFRAKIKSMQNDPTRYFVANIDPIQNDYLLTDFRIGDGISYINDLRTYSAEANETIVFDLNTTDLKGWRSFTPENYCFLDGNLLNVQMFAFKNGLPYAHYNVNQNNSYNEFFGVQCGRVIWLVMGVPQFKKKQFLSIENYCKQSLYFSDQIITEAGQQSYLFLDNFTKADFLSFAPFMCDVNSISEGEVLTNTLTEGNPLYGMWISVRLIGEPSQDNNYSEYLGSIINYFNQEKTG